jgi:hypothetical protein
MFKKAILIVMAAGLAAFMVTPVLAWHPHGNHTAVCVEGECEYAGWWNYDSVSQDLCGGDPCYGDCAWPVTMLFWQNAEIDKVKSWYALNGWTIFGVSEYERLRDDATNWVWDSDRGVKYSVDFYKDGPDTELVLLSSENVTLTVQ